MIGSLYIDGIDIYAEYGVFISDGGHNELVCYAPMKNAVVNNWQEQDGHEVDFEALALDSRELSIKFASHNAYDIGGFMAMLSGRVYHEFELMQLERTYTLRLVSQPNLSMNERFGLFTLRFADDFPPENIGNIAPCANNTIPIQGYEIDEVDLSKYGVRVLEGTLTDIRRAPAVKKSMLQNFNLTDDSVVECKGADVVYEPKDVKIYCLMRADTIAEFWQNYDALLFDLSRSEERSLYLDKTGYEYPFYYKSCEVSEFCFTANIWLMFNLTLVFTSFRVGSDEHILASERGEWIETESNNAIDLNNYFKR